MKHENPIRARIRSFRHAFAGIGYALKSQVNMRIHLVVFLAVIAAGFFFNISAAEWIAILIVSGLVFSLELLNTAIEVFLDKHYPEHDEAIGRVKDLCAGAVLVSAIAAAIIGLIIFLPKIIAL